MALEHFKLETESKISDSTARAAEAELKLEQLRKQTAARHLVINADAFVASLSAAKSKLPVEIMFPKDDGEGFLLAIQFCGLISARP